MKVFSAQVKNARQEALFWAKCLRSKSAMAHPEWVEKYINAKKRFEEIKLSN